jgi:hypothetical protein
MIAQLFLTHVYHSSSSKQRSYFFSGRHRYLDKEQGPNLSMTLLMTAGYFSCVGKITVGVCKYTSCLCSVRGLIPKVTVKIGGAGRHMATLSSTEIAHILQLQTALQILCPLTTSFIKLGILSLLYHILARTSRVYTLVIQATFGLVLTIMLIQVIIPFANCKPFSNTWSTSMKAHESCAIPSLSLWRYLSIPNIITTILLICIPTPALYNLRVKAIAKLSLGLIFCVCIWAWWPRS